MLILISEIHSYIYHVASFVKTTHKAMAARAIFHPRLQFNFQKLLHCHRTEENASRLHGLLAKFAEHETLHC